MTRRSCLLLALLLTACPSTLPDDDDNLDDDDGADEAPWFCAERPEAPTADGPGWSVQTEHYDAYLEIGEGEAREIAWLLEASYGAMASWFNRGPIADAPLRVELYETEQRFLDAIIADGLEPPFGAGGFYHSSTATAYAWRQPTVWYTRVIVLHEAAHQAHHHVRTDGHFPPAWYDEGLAEYLSLHDFDEGCARLGRLPLLSIEDLHAQARDELAGGGVDLDGEALSRPIGGALFGFLDDLYEPEFAEFRSGVDGGSADAIDEFEAALGGLPSSFEEELADWLDGHQQAMTPVYLEWIHRHPGSVHGWSDGVLTMAALKGSPDRFEISFAMPPAGTDLGLLLGFDDPSNYLALLVDSQGQFSAFTVTDGAVNWPPVEGEAVVKDGLLEVRVEHGPDESTVTAGGKPFVVERPFTAAGGPAIYDGSATFEGIAWE